MLKFEHFILTKAQEQFDKDYAKLLHLMADGAITVDDDICNPSEAFTKLTPEEQVLVTMLLISINAYKTVEATAAKVVKEDVEAIDLRYENFKTHVTWQAPYHEKFELHLRQLISDTGVLALWANRLTPLMETLRQDKDYYNECLCQKAPFDDSAIFTRYALKFYHLIQVCKVKAKAEGSLGTFDEEFKKWYQAAARSVNGDKEKQAAKGIGEDQLIEDFDARRHDEELRNIMCMLYGIMFQPKAHNFYYAVQ